MNTEDYNSNITPTEATNIFQYQRVSINGKIYYLDVSKEALVENYITSLLIHVPKNHPFSLLSNQLVLAGNKRPDYSTDLTLVNKTLLQSLRLCVGTKSSLNGCGLELKKTPITSQTILGELLFLPSEEDTSSQFNPKNSKCSLTAYKKYASNNGYKLKSYNFNLVSPVITGDAYQTAYYFNNAVQNIAGININIKLYTLQEFINLLINLLPKDKWFIAKEHPAICLAKSKVNILVEAGLATII